MKIDRLGRFTAAMWLATACLAGITVQFHHLMPILMVPLSLACTGTAVLIMRPQVAAADEVLRLGIELGERRARRVARPVVVPMKRICTCGADRRSPTPTDGIMDHG